MDGLTLLQESRSVDRWTTDAGRRVVATAPDFSRVLVVGHSQITRVVVAKIIERVGLKPVSEAAETAAERLRSLFPGTVVLDGGADNRDCDHLLEDILALRRVSRSLAPAVILMSTRNGTPESLSLSSTIDAVVAKPITPERLQPVVLRLIERARG
jgi:CheY-like chemotaxis protein